MAPRLCLDSRLCAGADEACTGHPASLWVATLQPLLKEARDWSPTSVLARRLGDCSSSSGSGSGSGSGSDSDSSPCGAAPAAWGGSAAQQRGAGQAPVAIKEDSCRVARCAPGRRLRPEDVPLPRANTRLEEAAALASMLLLFGRAPRPCLLARRAVLRRLLAELHSPCSWTPALALAAQSPTSAPGHALGVRCPRAPVRTGLTGARAPPRRGAARREDSAVPRTQLAPAFRDAWLWDTWRRRFRLRAITPPVPYLDTSRRFLCCQFPCGPARRPPGDACHPAVRQSDRSEAVDAQRLREAPMPSARHRCGSTPSLAALRPAPGTLPQS